MPFLPISYDKYRKLACDDDDRSHLVARSRIPSGYKFGGMQAKRFRVRMGSALARVNLHFKNLIEATADAKFRRMQRELELRGIRYENDNWTVRKPQSKEPSR
jgi:hypothetical protein